MASTQPDRMIHESPIPFREDPSGTAAVYCSDGRWGDHVEELLRKRLGLAQLDRLVVPGGPAVLVEQAPCFFEMQGVLRQLQFLIEARQLRRVLLIAHAGCLYYLRHLRVAPQDMEAQQRKDLTEAVERVRRMRPGLSVHAILGHMHGDRVRFELLES